jgi:DNA-binding transcriptional regulator LsrR (DeoR family)
MMDRPGRKGCGGLQLRRAAAEVRKLYLAGVSQSGIAHKLDIGRTSVRRMLRVKR